MNICIFAKSLPVHITGGMEIHVQSLAEGLIKRDHNVTIITAPHPDGIEKEAVGALTIYYIKSFPRITRERFYKESAELFERLNNERQFDIVHSQSTLACGYVKYCKKTAPLVLTSHGTASNEIKTVLQGVYTKRSLLAIPIWSKIRLLDEPVIYDQADKIIAVSDELCDDLTRQYKIATEKVVVIPNGIDINKFNPVSSDALRGALNITEKKIIVSVGRIDRQKGFHLLIKALPYIIKKADVELVLVGTGPYLRNLKLMAEKAGLLDQVIFAGRVSDGDLPKYYNLADVFAFPTLRLEGLPYVIPEAMACGKPVISSGIGGILTAIDNYKNGILIEPGNLEELKDRILEVLNDPDLAQTLGQNGRKKVIEKFSLDKMVEDTIKVYEDVLN